ncbi:MAG TPA: TatD family deoxyribonuclease [Anaerolineae bacterium]|nr:TatD family deoxyribonuclease [Anaerolineae bacterium]
MNSDFVEVAALIDSHCHLDLPHFDEDRDEVIARAREAGVVAMVTQGVDLPSSRRAIALAERYPEVYAAVGIHPNDCADFQPSMLDELRSLAAHPKVVAIGEIGLDDYWKTVPMDQQIRVLRLQLDLAAALGLPVILHDREAHEPIMAELRAWVRERLPGTPLAQRPPYGVLHSFSGDLAMAHEAYDLGFILGLAGPVTFKNARGLQVLARQLDPDRLMIETDAPYLSPHPYRGKRNEPARVKLVAEKLAELWDMPFEQVAFLTTGTARAFFAFDHKP